MIYAKIFGGLLVAVLVVLAIRWCAITIDKAGKYEATVAQLEQERAQNAASIKAIAQDIADDASGRVAFADRLDAIDAKIAGIVIPPAKTLIQPLKEVPGAPCNSFGVSDSFVGVYNEAARRAGTAQDQTH